MTGPENVTTKQEKGAPAAFAAKAAGDGELARTFGRFRPVFSSDAVAPLLAALPLSLCLALFPQGALNTSWDGSWCAVLNHAHESHLQFGTQVVFPYGPLGYLLIPYFWLPAFWSRLLFTAALNFASSAGICLVAWRLNLWWRLLGIGMFVLVTGNIDYGVPDFLLNVSLLGFGLLCLLEERPRLTPTAFGLALLAAAAALAKFSALMTAGLTIGAVAMDWLLRGRPLASLAIAGGWISASVFGWMILGQDLSHLPTYIARGFALSSGYDQTMGIEATSLVSICGVLLALLILRLVFLSTSKGLVASDVHPRVRRVLLLAWLLSFLFMTWKHGFVRADAHHVVYFVGFAAVLAPLLTVLNRSGDERATGQSALALTCCMLGLLTLQFRLEPQYLDPGRPFLHLARNLHALFAPDRYFEQMNDTLKSQRVAARLPRIVRTVGCKSIDVFGNKQAFAVLNGLNLQPRPVFQSYAAYNEPLMRINQLHYLSDAAPEFVMLRLEPIDERFPPMEDARLLPLLLTRYEFAGDEGPFILLRARYQSAGRGQRESIADFDFPKLTVLYEGALQPGERLNLARFGETNLWLELRPEPTLAGRVRQVLYRPTELQLVVWGDSPGNGPRRFRAPAPMLSAGFLASPLLSKAEDFANASRGCAFTRPSAFAVELGMQGKPWWKNQIRFRVSKIQAEPRPSEFAAQPQDEANSQTHD